MRNFFILLWMFIPLQIFADTSVWKIKKDDKELFIGGTIHVLSHNDYPLPEEFQQAFDASQMLVLETNLVEMMLPDAQMKMLQELMYQDERSLKTELKASTYRRLLDYTESIGIPIEIINKLKPSMAMVTLTMMEAQRLGLSSAGVDMFFNEQAIAKGKALGELESVDEQIEILVNMGKGQEDALVLNMLNDLKSLPTILDKLKTAWREGNLKQLEFLGIKPMLEQPEVYQTLLVTRNNNWLDKIEAFLETEEKEFILVGALHLAGNDGVLEQLQKRGYQIERF